MMGVNTTHKSVRRATLRLALKAALVAVLLISSSHVEARMEWITIGKDGRSFVMATSGKRFSPRGFNYDRDYKMRLLEDYWEFEWSTVESDFAEMRKLGANVVRIHLHFARFMDSADKPNKDALDRLERLVMLAEREGLYLDLTGLACYRKGDCPAWYNRLSETDRWRAQAVFWEAVAKRCADRPAVFCYNFMNEPVVPAGKMEPDAWLAGELSGFTYVQYISLDQQDRPREQIALKWLKTMAAAIRKHDRRHLTTVGLVDWSLEGRGLYSGFAPAMAAREVDFLCVHIYPESGKIDQSLDILKGFCVGKPVVIEETFPMNCSTPELRQFLNKANGLAAGWLGFYWGKTLEDYRQSSSPSDALMVSWLELFKDEVRSGK